ncbi:MAG: hypothetical protein ABEJ30_05700 [Halorientalis sp.]
MTSERPVDRVWAALAERLGDDLRAVSRYGPSGYETRARDDVDARYSDDEEDEVFDSVVLEQMNLASVERSFKLGSLTSVVQVFDDAWVVIAPDSLAGKSGVLVSVDRPGDDVTMADVDWICDFLDSELEDTLAE